MFEFYLSLSERRFERAAQLLEQGPHSSGTEAMWATLCHAAFEDSNLKIAERCWKRLGGEARADFLRKKTGESVVASDRTSTAMEQQVRPEVGESSERAVEEPQIAVLPRPGMCTAALSLFSMDPKLEVDEDEAVALLKAHGLSNGRIRAVMDRLDRRGEVGAPLASFPSLPPGLQSS
jgi:hypothetical protein